MRHFYLLFSLFLINVFSLNAQQKMWSGSVETSGGVSSNEKNPFWLQTNQFGIIPASAPFVSLKVAIAKDFSRDSSSTVFNKKWDWGFGVAAFANQVTSFQSLNLDIIPFEGYAKLRYKSVELYAGKRREVFGLGDTTLTSGFWAWSGNALPIPKVQLQTLGYVPLRFLKNKVAISASYSHGWFNVPYIDGVFLHQKSFYLRFGKPLNAWHLQLGINHHVQWGGRADYLKGTLLAVDGKLPASLRDYVSVVTGTYPDKISSSTYTVFDGSNRVGNHLGSIDLAVSWRGPKREWMLYYQHPYEDASGLAFQNMPDGLYGLRWVRHASRGFFLKRLVVEYLTTLDQSGSEFDLFARFQGSDNYFNHSQYVEGWSYRNRSIGTPLLITAPDLNASSERTTGGFFPDNRLQSWYVGSEWGVSNRLRFLTRLSYIQSFGSYSLVYDKPVTQLGALFSAECALFGWKNTTLITSIALDEGRLIGSNRGGYLSLRKKW